MKFFTKTLLKWNEPMLFAARVRDRRGWTLRGVLALVIFVAMLIGFFFDWGANGRRPKFSVLGGVALSAFVGVFLTSLLDMPSLNKEVTIDENGVQTFGNAGTVLSHGNWKLRDIVRVRLYTPEEFGRSFGVMQLVMNRGEVWLGVPAKMPASRIAGVLAKLGVSVELPGWEPGHDAPPAPPRFVASPTASARVETLPEHVAGQIMTPAHQYTAMAIEVIPLLVPLFAFVGAVGFFVYQHLIAKAGVSLLDLEVGVGALVLFIGGFWVAARFGSVVPTRYMRGVARSVVELRPDAVVDPRDDDAVYVSVVPRAHWGKMMLNQATDVGFLKVDEKACCLLFEGDRQRWRIPAASLVSVGVESYVPLGKTETPVPAEDEAHQERYFLTVIRARVGDGDWEAPVSKAAVEWRPRTNRVREANAAEVCDRVRALLPSGWVLDDPSARARTVPSA